MQHGQVMRSPSRSQVSIVVIALLIGAIGLGLAAIPGSPASGFAHPLVLFAILFFGILLLGLLLDRAARNASSRR
jgi:ABC-type proline/glycine betaine transport system permease subunit